MVVVMVVLMVVMVVVLMTNRDLLPNISDTAKHITVDHFLFHHSVPETISLHIRPDFLGAEESRPVLIANYLGDTTVAMMTTIVVVVAVVVILMVNGDLVPNICDT